MFITNCILYNSIGILLALIIVLVAYCKWLLSYWKRKDVECTGAELKNSIDLLRGNRDFGDICTKTYLKYKAKGCKHGGFYVFLKPIYLPVDVKLIKTVFNDFKHFFSRGLYVNGKVDTLSMNLFNQEGELWQTARSKLSPTFTLTKIKNMFSAILAISGTLKEIIEENSNKRIPIDIRELTDRYTIDITGLFTFSITPQAMKSPQESMLYQHAAGCFPDSFESRLRMVCEQAVPHWLLSLLNFKLFSKVYQDFFTKFVEKVLKFREGSTTQINDCITALLQLKNKDADDQKGHTAAEDTESFKQMVAHSYVIFIGGFHTTSSTLSFLIYELCVNPEVQEKLRNDINAVLEKHNNNLTYDALMEMDYLEQVFCETLRKYPPAAIITRKCTKNFKVEDTNVTIEKGTPVIIPVRGVHYDPEYYPNPEKFDPERFSKENKADRPAIAYMPFGDGPKGCIGKRLAIAVVKLTMVDLLRSFTFRLNCNTKTPLKIIQRGLVMTSEEVIRIDVNKIKQENK